MQKNSELSDLLHFDPRTHILAVEDPKFFFFIKHLTWGKFSELVGYLNTGFTSRYDFALSFSGADRAMAKKLFEILTDMEFSAFYDGNEQSRMMATDIEQYLAPIYQSEATYVICLLSETYPQRVWTRFESRQFSLGLALSLSSRFGLMMPPQYLIRLEISAATLSKLRSLWMNSWSTWPSCFRRKLPIIASCLLHPRVSSTVAGVVLFTPLRFWLTRPSWPLYGLC